MHVSSPLAETECNKCHKTYYHARCVHDTLNSGGPLLALRPHELRDHRDRSKKKAEDDNSLRRLRDHQATSCGARADRPLNLAYRNWDHDQRKFIYASLRARSLL